MLAGYACTPAVLDLGLQISAGIIALGATILVVGIPASALRETRR